MARMMKCANSVSNASHHGFEAPCWATADKLRGNLGAAEHKHVVLGLIFLKSISEAVGKLRNARAFNSTIEIRPPEFVPSSNQSGEAETYRIAAKICSPAA